MVVFLCVILKKYLMKNQFISTTAFFLAFILSLSSLYAQETFTDGRDGTTYNIITIGSQKWMGENLKYKTETGCWDPEGAPELRNNYGCLYSFEVAKNVCPIGWHLPTSQEFSELAVYLGGVETAGNKLKEKGVDHWSETNLSVTNSSGFSARGSGNRWDSDDYDEVGEWVSFWTTSTFYDSELEEVYVFGWTLYSDESEFEKEPEDPTMGLSVRCIMD